jgi:GDP-L-fucose synthase
MIEANGIHTAHQNSIKRPLFLSNTGIHPKAEKQPMREAVLLTDLLGPTDKSYALQGFRDNTV